MKCDSKLCKPLSEESGRHLPCAHPTCENGTRGETFITVASDRVTETRWHRVRIGEGFIWRTSEELETERIRERLRSEGVLP